MNKLLFWGGLGLGGSTLAYFLLQRFPLQRKVLPIMGKGATIHHRYRLKNAHPLIQNFMDEWERTGPFPLKVPKSGGERDDAMQAELYAKKRSKARTAEQTPHGRRAAGDFYPAIEKRRSDGSIYVAGIYLYSTHPEMFEVIGARMKQAGLKWGGTFRTFFDAPHGEVPYWRTLPYPPAPLVS